VRIHSRSDNQWRLRRQNRRRKRIVRVSVRHLGDRVRCRGSDNDRIGSFCNGYMVYAQFRLRIEYIGNNGAMRDAPEGQGSEELAGFLRHNDIHERSRLRQLAGKIDSLVARDAPGDTQRNEPTCQRVGHLSHFLLTTQDDEAIS
jgi:hypothetical protein